MNPHLEALKSYPFERLAALKAGITPPADLPHIPLSIGEPKHAPPEFVVEALVQNLGGLASYPQALGLPALREAIAAWLIRRFKLSANAVDPEQQVLPVSGTREGLFAFVQAMVDAGDDALVLMPNPFYQIYEGATLLAGAQPWYLNTFANTGFLPDLDAVPESVWQRCQVLFLCSPGNPTGAVMDIPYMTRVLELADRYDFVIAADECYSEIYLDEAAPPPGMLEACAAIGRDDFRRVAVFHSLSKRSNVPGMRSGFVAGDAELIHQYRLYRTYHGCAAPLPVQQASIAAWSDDAHVADNRRKYQEKFAAALEILQPVMDVAAPPAAFYLWPNVGGDDEAFARDLFAEQNVTVLPGQYLSRDTEHGNPGAGRIRISLVASVEECAEAARRIRTFMESRNG